MMLATFWLTLAATALISARVSTASRKRESARLAQLDEDRTADLQIDGPPRFNG